MKKLIFIWIMVISAVLGVGVGYGLVSQFVSRPKAAISLPPANSNNEIPQVENTAITPTSLPQISNSIIPKKLVIPKIGVSANVEKVGLDSKKNMDVPKEAMNVGWYSLGYKVGENGNAVMAGHLDRKDGSAAVFYKLSSLEVGDKFSVIGEDGKELEFRITAKQSYPTDKFPVATVFGSSDKPKLNLITCSGSWDSNKKSYTTRTVVFSELKSN